MWLVKKGHHNQAKESLIKLRGLKYDEKVELSELENLASSNEKLTMIETLTELKSRKNVIPFLIIAVFMMLQVLFSAYLGLPRLFEKILKSYLVEYLCNCRP